MGKRVDLDQAGAGEAQIHPAQIVGLAQDHAHADGEGDGDGELEDDKRFPQPRAEAAAPRRPC